MTFPAKAVVVYSGSTVYSRTRSLRVPADPQGRPAITLTTGAVPRWVIAGQQQLMAVDPLRGGSIRAWLDGNLAPSRRPSTAAMAGLGFVSMSAEIASLALDAGATAVAEADASVLLDEAMVLMAGELTGNELSRRVMHGIFLQRAAGDWIKLPTFELFPPSVSVGRDDASTRVELAAARDALAGWHPRGSPNPRIEWAQRALLTAEPWSRFVWLVFSLEQLVKEDYRALGRPSLTIAAVAERCLAAATPAAHPNWRKPSLTLRFAVTAARRARSTALQDVIDFHRLLGLRNAMLHGETTEAPDEAAQVSARRLVLRYNRLCSLDTLTEESG